MESDVTLDFLRMIMGIGNPLQLEGTSYAHHLNSLPKKSTATSCEIHAWSICWSLKTAESVLERGSHKTFKSKGEKNNGK